MPKPFKTTVEINGESHEVEVTPPEGYFDQEEVNTQFVPRSSVESTVQTRVDRAKRDTRTALLDDEDFVQEVSAKHGLQKAGEDPPGMEERLKAAQKEWERQHLTPLKTENEELKKGHSKLLQSKLSSDLLSAAAGKVQKGLMKAEAGKTPAIVSMLSPSFAWDDEHGHYAVIDGHDEEGNPKFRYSGSPNETGSPHMGVDEFMAQWVKDPDNAPFIETTRQPGSGIEEPGSGPGGEKTIPIDDLDAAGGNLEGLASGEVVRTE